MSRSGIALITANAAHRIALRGVRLRSRLSGMSQRTTVEQTFVNLERQAIEAVYTFPLPEGAAVCGFEVVTGDRVLTGRIEESEQAIEQYEDAVSEGHGAFMMEQDRPDVFTVRVGNLKPQQAATIRLTYVCPLEKADKSIRVSFPTTVAPRYVTDTATDPLTAMIDGDAVNPPHVLHVPYGLRMEVEVDLGRDLRAIHSPSHAVQVQTTDAGTALVTLAAGMTEMNRDIVLTLDLKKEHQPAVQATPGKQGESFLAVTFVPEFDEHDLLDLPPAETVFVLDCSGSMQGDSIRQATAALELCLRSLSPGDTFNVCRFGSTYRLMAKEPVPYTQETLERALKYVRQGANLGGTELYAPLEAILEVPPNARTVRQVILLTDGEVSNEPAVIELARRHRGHNRIFSFGIGAASSSYLVKGIARATGGAAEFITANERIDDKVLRTFSRLSSPMVGDVSIDWGDAEVQTLAEIPPVFDGDLLGVFGRCLGRLPKEVTLSCNTPAGPRRWTLSVPSPADDAGVIATMWARRTIQSIEEVNGLNTLRRRKRKPTREQEMLVALSKEFGLLSCLTTFIAVEHRSVEERNEGRPALRRVPVQLAKGWGGVEDEQLLLACLDVDAAPAPRRRGGLLRALKRKLSGPAPSAPSAPAPQRRASQRGHDIDRTLRSIDKSMALGDTASEADELAAGPVNKLVLAVFAEAVRTGAAEVRLEAATDRLALWLLIEGQLVEGQAMPLWFAAPVIKQLRFMAGLTEDPAAVSQQGRIRLSILDQNVNVDVSTSHGPHGECILLRFSGARSATEQPPGEASLMKLLSLQQAEGWFGSSGAPEDELEKLIANAGHDPVKWLDQVRTSLPDVGGGRFDSDRVVRATLALLALIILYGEHESLWRRAHLKGLRFIAASLRMGLREVEAWVNERTDRIRSGAPVGPSPALGTS